jgi:hypothetical protein
MFRDTLSSSHRSGLIGSTCGLFNMPGSVAQTIIVTVNKVNKSGPTIHLGWTHQAASRLRSFIDDRAAASFLSSLPTRKATMAGRHRRRRRRRRGHIRQEPLPLAPPTGDPWPVEPTTRRSAHASLP